jgi:N-acetylglutamate synthase-like GNAT family acetyltransferase
MQTNLVKIDIVQYQPGFQAQIEDLVVPIQQLEFGVPITREEQPDLIDIAGTFQHGCGNFWVALDGESVVGTIGIVDIGDDSVALKKMFVRADLRGKQSGVAARLMEQAQQWCRKYGIKNIYLGTTAQMKAAHRFYEKNRFAEVREDELPESFPIVHVDSKFYVCRLR